MVAIGLADDLWSGFRARLSCSPLGATDNGNASRRSIPLWALARTRSPSAAVLISLSANALNQLDTRPGRALKAFLLGSLVVGRGCPGGRSPSPS